MPVGCDKMLHSYFAGGIVNAYGAFESNKKGSHSVPHPESSMNPPHTHTAHQQVLLLLYPQNRPSIYPLLPIFSFTLPPSSPGCHHFTTSVATVSAGLLSYTTPL